MTNPSIIIQELDENLYRSLRKHLTRRLGKETPFKTGGTAGSWDVKRIGEYEYMLINTNGLIAQYLNDGTGLYGERKAKYPITPNEKSMLKFPIKKAPRLKTARDRKIFSEEGEIFFFNKQGRCILGFKKEGGRIYCFARKVMHPGIKGRHFVEKVLNDHGMWKEIENEIA